MTQCFIPFNHLFQKTETFLHRVRVGVQNTALLFTRHLLKTVMGVRRKIPFELGCGGEPSSYRIWSKDTPGIHRKLEDNYFYRFANGNFIPKTHTRRAYLVSNVFVFPCWCMSTNQNTRLLDLLRFPILISDLCTGLRSSHDAEYTEAVQYLMSQSMWRVNHSN